MNDMQKSIDKLLEEAKSYKESQERQQDFLKRQLDSKQAYYQSMQNNTLSANYQQSMTGALSTPSWYCAQSDPSKWITRTDPNSLQTATYGPKINPNWAGTQPRVLTLEDHLQIRMHPSNIPFQPNPPLGRTDMRTLVQTMNADASSDWEIIEIMKSIH